MDDEPHADNPRGRHDVGRVLDQIDDVLHQGLEKPGNTIRDDQMMALHTVKLLFNKLQTWRFYLKYSKKNPSISRQPYYKKSDLINATNALSSLRIYF